MGQAAQQGLPEEPYSFGAHDDQRIAASGRYSQDFLAGCALDQLSFDLYALVGQTFAGDPPGIPDRFIPVLMSATQKGGSFGLRDLAHATGSLLP